MNDHDLAVAAIEEIRDRYGRELHRDITALIGDVVGSIQALAMDYPDGWDEARAFLTAVANTGRRP